MVIEQMRDIVSCAGEKVVDTKNLVASFEKPLAEVRAQKASAPSDKNALPYRGRHSIPPKRFGCHPGAFTSWRWPSLTIDASTNVAGTASRASDDDVGARLEQAGDLLVVGDCPRQE
jgi:hypothetical protein